MKLSIKALVLGALGVLAIQAAPVTQITGGAIARSYSGFVTETDSLDLNGIDFRILLLNMTDAVPLYQQTPFTDHVSAGVIWQPLCQFCDPVLGSLDLDVTTFLNYPLGQYPGPDSSVGRFYASGTFTAPGINVSLSGIGTTRVALRPHFDPDPGFFFYLPGGVSYSFEPVPEPALAIPTGLGLLALVLMKRRAGNRSRPPQAEEPCH